jgi:hypothetical protein
VLSTKYKITKNSNYRSCLKKQKEEENGTGAKNQERGRKEFRQKYCIIFISKTTFMLESLLFFF